ncbi:MAG: DUF3168 domain-containing protein [Pseudomonadota bacterium]
MTYAISQSLQEAVFETLSTNAELTALVGSAVFDAEPEGMVPEIYVSLGVETVRDRSTKSGAAAAHDIMVSVVTTAAGFKSAKVAAGVISDALVGATPPLDRGGVCGIWFVRGRARRVRSKDTRRIDLTFRVLVEDE